MAYHLGGCLDSQLAGIHIHGCQGRKGESGEKGIVKGQDGYIPRYGQPQTNTGLLQGHCQYVIADQYGRGSVLPCEQGRQGLVLLLRHRRHLHAQLAVKRNAPLCQGQHISHFPVVVIKKRMVPGQAGNPYMAQI